jgi:hypothetical protein
VEAVEPLQDTTLQEFKILGLAKPEEGTASQDLILQYSGLYLEHIHLQFHAE